MKNITRTIRTLTVEYPVKGKNGFETRTASMIDAGAAAVRAAIKNACLAENVKFLGEYDVTEAVERTYSMPVSVFVEYASCAE